MNYLAMREERERPLVDATLISRLQSLVELAKKGELTDFLCLYLRRSTSGELEGCYSQVVAVSRVPRMIDLMDGWKADGEES